jgi:hypothetical protein
MKLNFTIDLAKRDKENNIDLKNVYPKKFFYLSHFKIDDDLPYRLLFLLNTKFSQILFNLEPNEAFIRISEISLNTDCVKIIANLDPINLEDRKDNLMIMKEFLDEVNANPDQYLID